MNKGRMNHKLILFLECQIKLSYNCIANIEPEYSFNSSESEQQIFQCDQLFHNIYNRKESCF